jgi:hypothetical protein
MHKNKKQAEKQRLADLELKRQTAQAVLAGLCANPDVSMDIDRRRITPENARECLAKSAWKSAGWLMRCYTMERKYGAVPRLNR